MIPVLTGDKGNLNQWKWLENLPSTLMYHPTKFHDDLFSSLGGVHRQTHTHIGKSKSGDKGNSAKGSLNHVFVLVCVYGCVCVFVSESVICVCVWSDG